MPTCSNVDISGMDGAFRVLCQTSVNLGVHFLPVIFSSEGRKYQIAIRQNLMSKQKNGINEISLKRLILDVKGLIKLHYVENIKVDIWELMIYRGVPLPITWPQHYTAISRKNFSRQAWNLSLLNSRKRCLKFNIFTRYNRYREYIIWFVWLNL